MFYETGLSILSQLFQFNIGVFIILILLFIFITYKLFQYVLKAIFSGLIFAVFPVAAHFMGLPVPLTLETILWSALAGVVLCFMYSMAITSVKIIKIIFFPFRRFFKDKPNVQKVIVKEVVKEKE